MTNVVATEDLLPALREAHRGRLRELDGNENAPPASQCSDAEAEEMLRKLMVRYRPRLARSDLSTSETTALVDAIQMVASRVTWNDLRFVDCLNAVSEVWKSEHHGDARDVFRAVYRRALLTLINS